MKRLVSIVLSAVVILSFSDCSVNQKFPTECISDVVETVPISPMYINSDVPQGATLSLSRDDGRYALFTHPDYEITQEIFSAASWDEAFFHISGRTTQELRPFLTDSFPYEKYRCTWTVAGEEETELCQSLIFHDSNFYYAITVQCVASRAADHAEAFSDLLSGAELKI